jgi:protoporphyrinogen/coproporphyrinogen III oxidase
LSKKIVILGAGISGLTTAYLLFRKGMDVTVIEKKNEVGGSIESIKEDGYIFDRGPNSGLETTQVISELVEGLNLKDQFVYANKAGNKRYILRNGQLHPLPMSPPAFLKTKLFSNSAKIRLMAEPFIRRSKDGYNQSVAEFVQRRLGHEFLDYAINPFVAGVYAGNPEELSVKSAFPKLYALEENYGGLIIGTIRSMRERKRSAEKSKQSAKMFSFYDGMQVLPKTIAEKLSERVFLSSEVKSVSTIGTSGSQNIQYKINFTKEGLPHTLNADVLISAVPAYIALEIFKGWDDGLTKHFSEIYYPPVIVLYLGYNKSDMGQPLDGFGYLIPSKEKKTYLGAIWSSVIFPNRAPGDKASFTLFIGGSRNPEVFSYDTNALIEKVRKEFEGTMKIKGNPVYQSYRSWQKAIPQYNLGYIEHENYFDEFQKKNPGIIFTGNYRGGISIGDCIKNSDEVAKKVIKSIERLKAAEGESRQRRD